MSSLLFADQVVLKNGDRLSGAVVSYDGKALNLKSDLAGMVGIPWDAVEEISSTGTLYVTSKAGQVVVGPVKTREGRLEIQTAEAGPVILAKDSVQFIRSKEGQAAYEAQEERLRKPHLLDVWGGNVDSGLAFTRGNSDTTNFNLATNIARLTAKDKISIYSTALFAKSNISGKSTTTAQAVRGGTRYDFNLSERMFAFGQLDLEHDEFQKLDLRNVLAGGAGYHAIKNAKTVLDLMVGGSFDQTYFSTDLTRKDGEVLLGEQFSRKLTKATVLTEGLQFFPNLSQSGEYRFTFDSSIVTTLSKTLSWQVTFSDRYLSNPLPGVKTNDALLTTGIHLTFGRKPS